MTKHIITMIEDNSIASELGIEPGDQLLTINGKEVKDVLDYRYLEKDEEIELVLYRPSTNEEWEYFIEKEMFDEIGLSFESGLMDAYKSCTNNCVFCFIDQLPQGMRETMYFKDDDARLSFLQGNYITLTNMKEEDFSRIIDYRLSPINVSIHTMNMSLRQDMLKNRFAGKLLDYMNRMYEADILMHGQIVLCKGINDGKELEYSIQEMMKYLPLLQSVSIVPVGLTKHRSHLEKLETFTRDEAKEIIDLVEQYQTIAMKKYDLHFIHAGDEFYFLAGEDMPKAETYDGYLQYENGVGMTRLLKDEFSQCYNNFDFQNKSPIVYKEIILVTGKLIAATLEEMAKQIMDQWPVTIKVRGIENKFFGPLITVSGLVTGTDIIEQIMEETGDIIYLPNSMLKADEDIFLDDVTLEDMSDRLHKQVRALDLKGGTLFDALLGKEINYEQ